MVAARSRALDHRKADVIAAERVEQTRKAAAYDDAVAVLEAKLGPSWALGCPTVADALVEPHTLRVLLGVPHPSPAASPEYIAELRAAAEDREAMLAVLEECGCEPLAGESGDGAMRRLLVVAANSGAQAAAEAITIDDSTPEGVLALLDAAIDALIRDDEAHLAESLIDERDGLAFELGGGLRDDDRFNKRRVDQLAARLGLDKPRAPDALDAQVESLASLDGSVLLARLHRLAASTDETIANPSDSGWSERNHLTQLGALALAFASKFGTCGGAF
jgi:hypothetical protein